MEPKNSINAILEALASQQQRGETSLIFRLKPDLIQDAMNALQDYRKLFAPVIPAVTDTEPIYAAYERMRQADVTQHTILLLVECQTMEEFREALGRLPMRKSSEWRSIDNADFWERYFRGINDSEVSDLG
jgi:DNA repair photolyase